jgi:hypothetical protein
MRRIGGPCWVLFTAVGCGGSEPCTEGKAPLAEFNFLDGVGVRNTLESMIPGTYSATAEYPGLATTTTVSVSAIVDFDEGVVSSIGGEDDSAECLRSMEFPATYMLHSEDGFLSLEAQTDLILPVTDTALTGDWPPLGGGIRLAVQAASTVFLHTDDVPNGYPLSIGRDDVEGVRVVFVYPLERSPFGGVDPIVDLALGLGTTAAPVGRSHLVW